MSSASPTQHDAVANCRLVFNIPELLDSVMSFSSRSDNARFAIVSKGWMDLALSHVWRNNPPVKALLSLLGPLVPRDNSLSFSRRLEGEDWTNFDRYAHRVKELGFNIGPLEDCDIGISVLSDITSTRTRLNILPNLTCISISASEDQSWLHVATLFLHTGLEHIVASLPKRVDGSGYVGMFFNEIALRAPLIKHLELYLRASVKPIDNGLSVLLTRLPLLKTLYVSPFTLTSSIIHSLETMPAIEQISIDFADIGPDASEEEDEEIDVREDVGALLPLESVDSFQKLFSLSLQFKLQEVCQFFEGRFAPTNLTELAIDILFENCSADLQRCLDVLSRTCTALYTLSLTSRGDPFNSFSESGFSNEPIKISNISALPAFKHLEHFELQLAQPVMASDKDLSELIGSCKNLEILHLNSEPLSDTGTSLTLGFLALLAQKETKLRCMSVYLDAMATAPLPAVKNPLRNVDSICFGISPVRFTDDIVAYLRRLLPEECRIDGQQKMPEIDLSVLDDGVGKEWEVRRSEWAKVGVKVMS